MNSLWRLVSLYAAGVGAVAVVATAVVWMVVGVEDAGAFLYGVGVGLLTCFSTALSVAMITSARQLWRILSGFTFVGRYVMVVLALAVPGYLGAWPIVAMAAGFAVVLLSENVLLLPGVFGRLAGSEPEVKVEGVDNAPRGEEREEEGVVA